MQGERTMAKTVSGLYVFRCGYLVMRGFNTKNHRNFKFRSHGLRNYETTFDLTHNKPQLDFNFNFNGVFSVSSQNSDS